MCIPFHEVNLSVTIEFFESREGFEPSNVSIYAVLQTGPLPFGHLDIFQLTKCQRTILWERRDSNPQSQKRADFNANLRPSTSLPCNFLFRYPVYALYTFMKFNLQLSSALFVIYRHTTFTELAGCSSNRFQLELHYHHFFYSPRGYQLPVTLPLLKTSKFARYRLLKPFINR